MKKQEPINRRNFLGKTAMLASAAGIAASARGAKAQINDSSGKSMPGRLGVGFIGVGIRGTQLLEASLGVAGVDAVAVCDLYDGHLARAKDFAGQNVITTKDYQQVLSRSDIDVVVIAAPDHWHKPMALEAFEAGKHVYIEKPLTHKWEDGEELIRAARRSGRKVQVGSQYMSMGCAQKATELIARGRIGKVTMVEGRIHRNSSTGAWYYPIPPDANRQTVDWDRFVGDTAHKDFDLKRFFQWRLFWDYSGGLPTDLFVHLVTATHQLMGVNDPPETVMAMGDIYHWKNYRDVPDQMCALAKYPEGFTLKLTSTANNGHRGPLLSFYGTEGTLEYNGGSMTLYYEPRDENFGYPTYSWERKTVEKFREIMRLDEDLNPLNDDRPEAEGPMEFGPGDAEPSTRAHLRNLYDAIREGKDTVEPMEVGVNAVNVGHMVNISYRTGKIVKWNRSARKVEV